MGSNLKRRVSQNIRLKRKAVSAAEWRMAFLVFVILSCIAVFCIVIINGTATTKYKYSYIQPDVPPSDSPSPPPTEPGHLVAAAPHADALAKRFLDALAKNDESAMKELRITKEEFCQYVWPELPSSKVPNLSCDFAWGQATLNSDAGFYGDLKHHKGKRYELIAVRFAKGSETYQNFNIHKDARLKIRDEKGVEREVKLFGAMLEMAGKFKLFSFTIDD